jgi:putative flippase GtrA
MTNAKQPDEHQPERRQETRRISDALPAIPHSVLDVAGWIGFFRQITFIRYGVVSVAALAVDLGIFMALLQGGMISALAAAIGYAVGIVTHWLLSSRKVFSDRVSERGSRERTQQKAMFVVSALLGLALTMLVVGLADVIGINPVIGKCFAIIMSFTLTYVLRNVVVFRGAVSGHR